MTLAAGNYQGAVGRTIAPMAGLNGRDLRQHMQRVQVMSGLGSVCNYVTGATAIGTGITSAVKTSSTVAMLTNITNIAANVACPSANNPPPSVPQAPPAQPSPDVVYVQQSPPITSALDRIAAQQNQSKSFLAGIDSKTWLMVGGGVALAAAAFFLLRK